MNRLKIFKVGLLMAVPFLLSGCFDDDYDLSNIDGTAEFQIKDLTIPMNIDNITLDNIIDIEEGGQIKTVDGEYVFLEEGNFKSETIKIPTVEIAAPKIEPSITRLDLEIPEGYENYIKALPFPLPIEITELSYSLEQNVSDFTYETHSVSEYIVGINKIGTELKVEMKFDLVGLDIVKSFSLKNFKLQLPKGLNLTLESENGEYDSKTGVLTIKDGSHSGHSLSFIMSVSEIDIDAAGIEYNYDEHSIIFSDHIGIYSGEVIFTNDDIEGTITELLLSGNFPKTIDLKSEYNLSDILVKTFTGDITYTLDAMDIAPIALNDIPDVLNQEGTNIVLGNPQIYVSVNNPLAEYSVYAQSGLSITSQWPKESKTVSLDNEVFTIAGTKENPMNVFCMSPANPEKYYNGYENAEYIPFTGLANVLSGDGLPEAIKVNMYNPTVPAQHVENFQLGKNFGDVQGNYTFYTPLELGANSQIVYTSTEDGWNDEELDNITIKLLEVSALVSNNLPLDIEITGYPIDVNGKQINNVEIEGMSIDANSVDKPLNIKVRGEIKHLDGFYFKAVAKASSENNRLKPSEFIELKNLRVKISGAYNTEL